jgi:hypothetical protein
MGMWQKIAMLPVNKKGPTVRERTGEFYQRVFPQQSQVVTKQPEGRGDRAERRQAMRDARAGRSTP